MIWGNSKEAKTGGAEILNKFAAYLKSLGVNAQLFNYSFAGNFEQNDYYKNLYDINAGNWRDVIDDENVIIFIPEIMIENPENLEHFCNFKKAQIIIWWMSSSFQYNDLTIKTSKRKMFYRLKFLEERCLHLYEGESAGRDLLYHGITNRMRFSHGVHPLFYTQKPKVEKQDIVCYNPFKPANAEFIEVIKAAMPDVKFVSIGPEQGGGYMTKEELIDIYDSAKVYVDFNEFEGREMCPREAALRDCVLLLNNEGCASTFDDYPIPNWNKIEKYGEYDVEKICEKIRYCLSHYEECLQDMSLFKNKCLTEPAMWKLYVQTLFGPMIPEENKIPQQV